MSYEYESSSDVYIDEEDIEMASRMIKKSHYKSTDKVLSYWERFGGLKIEDEDDEYYYRRAIEIARTENPYNDTRHHVKEHYYVHIFSPFRHAYQMDLLEQSREAKAGTDYPNFWYIFINVNTRFAFAYPLKTKTTNDCLDVLKKFLSEGDKDCVMLTSDEEKAFVSKQFESYCKQRGVSQRIINQQNHTALSIVDRFIRTLRDMNTPNKGSKHQSMDRKYRDFSEKRMNKLINIHNNTTLNMWNNVSPQELQNDPGKEEEYILYKLYEREREAGLVDWEIEINKKNPECVRYIIQRKAGVKQRYKVSREYYHVVGNEGHYYVIMAKNGKAMTLPRWRLVLLTEEEKEIYEFAKDIPDSKRWIIEKIEDFVDGKYQVKWVGSDERTMEPISNIRTRGTEQTKEEKKFWESDIGKQRKKEMEEESKTPNKDKGKKGKKNKKSNKKK